MSEMLERDPLEVALAATDPSPAIPSAQPPLMVVESPLHLLLLVSGWLAWLMLSLFAALMVWLGSASWQMSLAIGAASLLVLLYCHLRLPCSRLEVCPDHVERVRGKERNRFDLEELSVVGGKTGANVFWRLEPTAASIPGLLSMDGQHAGKTLQTIILLKQLGVKMAAEEWTRLESPIRDIGFAHDQRRDLHLGRVLLGVLAGALPLAGLIVLLALPLLLGLLCLCLCAACAAASLWAIKRIDRKTDQKISGLLYEPDKIAWFTKGEIVWAVRADEVRRFEVSLEAGYFVYHLVTHYGRRLSLKGAHQMELLRQINGRGYSLAWSDGTKDVERFLP